MILSVTTLGSRHGDAAGAAAKVVRYLDGRGRCPGGRDPPPLPELAAVDPTSGIVGYYADSVDGPGRWLGRGVATVSPTGVVDPEHLRAVLIGTDPLTGEQLLAPRGSAARRPPRPDATTTASIATPIRPSVSA